MFLPVSTGNDKLDGYSGIYWWSDADAQTWSILHTDRNRYRSGDTLNLWGYRPRPGDRGRAGVGHAAARRLLLRRVGRRADRHVS